MLEEKNIEQRLTAIEHTVADLKRRVDGEQASSNWLELVIGSVSDEQTFLEALEYGKSLRYADRPKEETQP